MTNEKINEKQDCYIYKNYQILVKQVYIDEKFEENKELKNYVDNYLNETEKELEKVYFM